MHVTLTHCVCQTILISLCPLFALLLFSQVYLLIYSIFIVSLFFWLHFFLVHFGVVAFHVPLSPTEGIYIYMLLFFLSLHFFVYNLKIQFCFLPKYVFSPWTACSVKIPPQPFLLIACQCAILSYRHVKLSDAFVCSPSRQCEKHHSAVWESHWDGRGGRWCCRRPEALLQQPGRRQHGQVALKSTFRYIH